MVFGNEGIEPPHIFVQSERRLAKLNPVRLARSKNFSSDELRRIAFMVEENAQLSREQRPMSKGVALISRARTVEFEGDELIVRFVDGRRLCVPLAWFPRLYAATSEQRVKWELLGDGEGIHWSEVDEDVSVEALLFTRQSQK